MAYPPQRRPPRSPGNTADNRRHCNCDRSRCWSRPWCSFLAGSPPWSLPRRPLRQQPRLRDGGQRRFLEANAGNPLDMKTVALATGHSLRSIYRSFEKERGYSPSEFLRKVRLENVRRRLLCPAPDDSVTRIAYEFGFAHLGRFAGLYKKAYGESPGDTIKASMRHRR